MPTDLTADQAATRDLALAFIDLAHRQGLGHRLLLQGLITAYQAVAGTHPCCTASAADMALRTGESLHKTAAGAAAATHIH